MELFSSKDFERFFKSKNQLLMKGLQVFQRWMKLPEANQLYDTCYDGPNHEFPRRVVDALGIRVAADPDRLSRIMAERQFILISNHPYGVVDGLILMGLFAGCRRPPKLVGHAVLKSIRALAPHLITVNPYTMKKRHLLRWRDAKKIIRGFREGNSLLFFPAGKVAVFTWRRLRITDRPWSSSCVKLIKRSGLPVYPVYIHGRNSVAFHVLNLIKEDLAFTLLLREMFAKRDKVIRITIGDRITTDGETWSASELRKKVYELKHTG